MSAISQFFALPELRIYLSEHVGKRSDLAALSRVDHLSRFFVTPLLFANVDVRLKDIVLIADALGSRPDLACRTLALTVRSPDYDDVRCREEDRRKSFHTKCRELASVLRVLSKYGSLESFQWLWEPGWLDNDEVPQSVWGALALNASSLRKVDIALSQADGECWTALTSGSYTQLRSLRIDLTKAQEWNSAKLQEMLINAQDLVSLNLMLPICRGPQDFALSFIHRNLRSLSFHGSSLTGIPIEGHPETKDFLKHHPDLEFLDLCSQTRFDVDDDDLPHLRAVSVDHSTLNSVPNLFPSTVQRPVKALRLIRMPHLTMDTVFTLCASVAPTLKYLHMDSSIFSFRANLPGFADLLRTLPGLVELRLGAESLCAFQLQHRLYEQDLVEFLKTLSDECAPPSLVALSFFDSRGKLLTQTCLDNLPRVPPALKQIAWDVTGTRYLYDIVEKDDCRSRAVLVSSSPSPTQRLWVQEAVVDHFGSETEGW